MFQALCFSTGPLIPQAHLHDGLRDPSTAKEVKPQHAGTFQVSACDVCAFDYSKSHAVAQSHGGRGLPKSSDRERGDLWPFLLAPTDGREAWQPHSSSQQGQMHQLFRAPPKSNSAHTIFLHLDQSIPEFQQESDFAWVTSNHGWGTLTDNA